MQNNSANIRHLLYMGGCLYVCLPVFLYVCVCLSVYVPVCIYYMCTWPLMQCPWNHGNRVWRSLTSACSQFVFFKRLSSYAKRCTDSKYQFARRLILPIICYIWAMDIPSLSPGPWTTRTSHAILSECTVDRSLNHMFNNVTLNHSFNKLLI